MSNLTIWELYFYIERDRSVRPVALIPINPKDVKVIKHDGQIFYDIKDHDIAVLKEDMPHS